MGMTQIGKMADIAVKANPDQFMQILSKSSATFCQQACGTVNAFVSNGAYKGVDSIFWRVEMPALMNNSRVTDVVIHIFE